MRNRPILQMVVIGLIATAIGIPIALIIPWFPTDASKQASNVRTLYTVLLIASVPIFVLVETVVLFSVWKFRMRPGDEALDGPPIHGNTRLEVLWTALPALLIISLCTFAYTKLRANEESKKGEMTVYVNERQFAFEFAYPQAAGKEVLSPVLYMPKDQPVVFKLRSYDVIHSFFVPEFSQKIDAVPGITTTLRVTATRNGRYPAECTELCGAGHSLMRSTVYVVSPTAFRTWLQSQRASAAPPIGSAPAQSSAGPATSSAGAAQSSPPATSSPAAGAAAGKAIFTGSAGCSSCHTLAAAGATGTVGPNLGTQIVPNAKKAHQSLKQYIFESITKPNAYITPGFKPNVMPQTFAHTLSQAQIQALVSFIASVTK